VTTLVTKSTTPPRFGGAAAAPGVLEALQMGVGGGTAPAQHVPGAAGGPRTRARRSVDRAVGADRRGRADRFGHRVESADLKALLCVGMAGAGSVAMGLARRIALGSAGWELVAALVCHILALPLVGVPFAILVVNALLPGVMTRATCELCAVWLLWNFGWLFYVSLIWPFLLSSFGTQHTYADVLYDYTVFLFFIPVPVVLGSGILKALSVRVGWRWGWRQRAVLGTALGTVALCMWASQYYVRPDGFVVTVLHTYISAYIHICIYTHMHMYIYTYVHIYIYTYVHIYIYTYVHMYICT